ncbi:MAG: FMN-binding glutamate synthase family protein [Candidatus Aenigmarchaeota archaeon]|nr:FMN-binding glutamate synthase family protein [Candidatus Aenigmarchaeota archaeon]
MEKWILDIKHRAMSGKALISGGRSDKLNKVSFDNLVFIPAQLTKSPVNYFEEKISSKTTIGKLSKHPLKLETPIIAGAMSFGALSKEAKTAIAKATARVGTVTNTGEGGMLPEERKIAKLLIAQYSTARFGVDDDYIKKADAIEIKIGQGAKPGQGGLLPAGKVTREIAKIRKIEMGKDVHSPPCHPDIKCIADLRKKVSWLRKLSSGKPVIIKLGAGDVENDVKLALKANPDVIAIDGMEGGTGAAPNIMLDDFGVPALSALVRARNIMDKLKAKQELLIGGGLNKGADVAKALALGADAVFMSFPLLISMGCMYCKQCYIGRCPLGITTQEEKMRNKLNVEDAVSKVSNFITSCTEEVKMAAAATGKRDIHKLCRKDLRSLDLLTERITGIELI